MCTEELPLRAYLFYKLTSCVALLPLQIVSSCLPSHRTLMHAWLAYFNCYPYDASMPSYECSKVFNCKRPQSVYTPVSGCCLLASPCVLQHTMTVSARKAA